MFNVERDRPRVDKHLTEQLASAKATDTLTVFVHAAFAGSAADAARHAGLAVVGTLEKVGVAIAVGGPADVRRVTTAKGVSFVEANRSGRYSMETSNAATRSVEARAGFDVTYLEPQPDKPGTSKRVCTTKRVKNRKTGRTRRVRSCRTVTTPPRPQPPITRTQHSPGVDGSGVTIAVLDTGTDSSHPMFTRRDGTSKVVRNYRQIGLDCDPKSTCSLQPSMDEFFVPVDDSDTSSVGGHGTHVSGIAAGVDVMTSYGERLHGTAPGADLVVIGMGLGLEILNPVMAFDWVVRHHRDPCGDGSCPPIRAVNNSYGFDYDFEAEAAISKLQRALVAEGVVVVWSAGNDGGDGSETVTNSYGADPTPGVLSVASYDDANNGTRTGGLSTFSSRGKRGQPLTYPDIAAPGDEITSACRPALVICRGGDSSDLNYGTISGTSMAAPNVAGVVAQVLQANPALTPAQVEDILEDTAYAFSLGGAYETDPTNVDSPTSFDRGHGLVDAAAAVARARALRGAPVAKVGCAAGDASVVDLVGDTWKLGFGGESATTEPAADIVETRVSWDPLGAVTFTTRLVDVLPAGLTLSFVDVTFVRGGDHLVARAERFVDGQPAYSLLDENGSPIAEATGRYDSVSDEVAVTITNAQLAGVSRQALTAGDFLQVAGVAAFAGVNTSDYAGATCPSLLGVGSAVPPPYTTIGSGAPVSANQPADARLAPGQRYEWDAGPYTTVAGLLCDRLGVSKDCYRQRVLALDVPAGGARFEVTITPDSPLADFDVVVRGPDRNPIARSTAFPVLDDPEGVERVSADVTQSGRYTIEVIASTTVMASYHGVAALAAK